MGNTKTPLQLNPDIHRQNLADSLVSIGKHDQKARTNYENFINKLFQVFTDNPPDSWRFRNTKYKDPVFRVYNIATGNINDFLIIGAAWEERGSGLIVMSKFFDEKYRALFPDRKDYYGNGDGVRFDWAQFNESKQDLYIQAIESMATSRSDWSLNFPVRGTTP